MNNRGRGSTDPSKVCYSGAQHSCKAGYLIHRFEANSLDEALFRGKRGNAEFLVVAPDVLNALKRTLIWFAARRVTDE
jgi:hypothetical protein